MMDTPLFPGREDDIGQAGEYVLGLLSDEERAAFEARMARDVVLRDIVAGWSEDLAPMTEGPDVTPPKAIKARLDKALFDAGRSRTAQLGRWLLGGLVGAAAAAAIVLVTYGPSLDTPPSLTAELQNDEGLTLAAAYDAGAELLSIRRGGPDPEEGRSYELWLIVGDTPPRSLGTLDDAGEVTVTLAGMDVVGLFGAVLAVSDEPLGGSTTGAPTGNVLVAGPLTAL